MPPHMESESAAVCEGGFLLRCTQDLAPLALQTWSRKPGPKLASTHALFVRDPNVPSGVLPVMRKTRNFWASTFFNVCLANFDRHQRWSFSHTRAHTHARTCVRAHTHTVTTRADQGLACRGMGMLVHEEGARDRRLAVELRSINPSLFALLTSCLLLHAWLHFAFLCCGWCVCALACVRARASA